MISRVSAVTPALTCRQIHGERAIVARHEPALIQQVVQLNGDAAAVRLVDAEADRSERRRQKRRVERALERLRQHALVDQVLNREQAGDVGLRFLEEARVLPSSPAAPSSGGRRR